MNNQIQVVLKSSTTEMSLNDHDAGIYIVPELDGLTGLPEIRTTSGVNAGYDGGWTSAQKFDARSIVIRGVIANDDKTEVERMRRELVALLAQGKNEQLELDFVTETGRAYEVQVRTIACDMAMQRVLTQQEFMITLRADDPLIYDNSSTGEEATVNISGATGGFRIPFEIPLAIDAGSEETVVQNSGLESVAPTIKMYGALHNPKIINHTTNQAMQVEAELGFTEGAWTTPVDAPEGTNVSFEPGREAPIESAKLKGNTTQQTYTGKNLLNTHGTIDADSLTGSGVSYTINADGTISTSGSNSGVYKSIRFLLTLPAGTYKFSGCPSGGTNNGYSFCVEPRGDSTLQLFDTGNGNEFTLTEQKTIRAYPIRIGADTGVNMNGKVFKPMITVSTASQDYEPYVGGVPAPNPDYPQTVQTVTGENVVEICGKNLFDKDSGQVLNAWIDYSSSSMKIISGNLWRTAWIRCLPNTQYAISKVLSARFVVATTAEAPAANVGILNYVVDNDGTSCAITTPANAKYLCVYCYYSNYDTALTPEQILASLQIELGSTSTAYKAYQGQSYEVNLGKNLFDVNSITENTQATTSGVEDHEVTYSASNYRAIMLIKVEPNSKYTLSIGDTNIVSRIYCVGMKTTTLESGHAFSWVNSGTTITTTSKDNYILGVLNISSGQGTIANVTNANVQFEKGSQATSYSAYFTPIELCKIGTYQNYIWKDGDTWKVHKAVDKIILDGNTGGWTAWSYSTLDRYYTAALSNKIAGLPQTTVALLSHFKFFGVGSGVDSINKCLFNMSSGTAVANGNITLTFKKDSMPTAASVSTWLSNNPVSLYYSLATPTDTAITNTALIEQLEALVDGNAVVYEGETNIAVTAAEGDMPGIAAIRYYTDKEPDQRDELIIDSRLKTITLNGLDVYHLQAPGSEFLMLAPGENKLSLQSDITGDNGYAKVSYKQGYLSI